MALTDMAIRRAKPMEKQQKLFDSGGLFLLVTPAGRKRWVLKYRFGGREKSLAFGTYPEVSLVEARKKRDAVREKLAANIDPGEAKKAEKRTQRLNAEHSFEAIAREWHAKYAPTWSDSHGDRILRRLEVDAFPWIGGKPMANLTPPDVLDILRPTEYPEALVPQGLFFAAIVSRRAFVDRRRERRIPRVPPFVRIRPLRQIRSTASRPIRVGNARHAPAQHSG
ncbi:tyrosine-type recombinase/integrase [Burkholderia savannae]|uniref:tyrosine-type recombinase/integrase n=1 Tax=Burkholderia savannae TaxID=1637837 RepID=UPI000B2121C3